IVLAVLGLFIDAILAGMLGLINALIAIFQEVRAKRALDRIAVLTRPVATVIRDGREQTIQIDDVVRDDLVLARAGDQIVADGPVIDAVGGAMDESLLSGESELVTKAVGDTLYAGSFCMSGQVIYRAEQIGRDSVAEQIDTEARVFNVVKTPLQREIIWLMRGLLVVILLLTLLVLGTFNRVSGTFPFDQTMMEDASRATAVLVGLIPQGLVLMITVTYAMSILRLARKNALVQHMNAAESLSHVDVLCLDKTGTITTNELSLHALTPLGIDQLDLQRALGDFVASSASMNRTASAIAASFPGSVRRLRHEAPFDSDRKWSALSFADDIDQKTYVLGAPEVLLPFLRAGTRFDDRCVDEWTSQGLRVLLFAASADVTAIADPLVPHLPVDLFPLGLIALRDELRADARETIDHFVQAGISLKLISGDHVNTVTTLARQAGIAVNADDQIVSGWQLEGLSDDEYEEIAQRGVIFGRVTPQQKERLVSALRRRDHYVAMIGDGVNDVPALKHAQVAIAMRSGTAVTRSISDVILLDDSFAALPDAFMEGQRIRNGLETT
ncbi:MAG: HAD-IC family P-type ATPase, partial [Thermomicrobiales bacterium]